MIRAFIQNRELQIESLGFVASIVTILAANAVLPQPIGYVAAGAWFAVGMMRVFEGRKSGWWYASAALMSTHLVSEAHAPRITSTGIIVTSIIVAYMLVAIITTIAANRRAARAQ